MVARAFLYMPETRIDKRHRRVAKWVLHHQITVEDLLAADINNNGFLRKEADPTLDIKKEHAKPNLIKLTKIAKCKKLDSSSEVGKMAASNHWKVGM
ncbi:hypothetical protein R6Q59_031966 [Mikania micrantha]|uniref:Uncharacterized protein n=1 Tax=Mikania micrantha TaxID=192012 RepID=A0A5N6LJR0_9ASTR|nr:hypothetical protein E3N88_42529 [Mikania micrantha]